MKWIETRQAMVGLALMVVPICTSVLWVSDTYATKQWTAEQVTPVIKRSEETERQLRDVQIMQVRHTAVLEHLTTVLTELKDTLKQMQRPRLGQ